MRRLLSGIGSEFVESGRIVDLDDVFGRLEDIHAIMYMLARIIDFIGKIADGTASCRKTL